MEISCEKRLLFKINEFLRFSDGKLCAVKVFEFAGILS